VADPYRENIDRRRHYAGSLAGAYRFVRVDLALGAATTLGGGFDVIPVPLSDIPP
jgi:hypothetical protein